MLLLCSVCSFLPPPTAACFYLWDSLFQLLCVCLFKCIIDTISGNFGVIEHSDHFHCFSPKVRNCGMYLFSLILGKRALKIIFFLFNTNNHLNLGFLGLAVVKNSPANAGDLGSVPGSGRSPGGGHGNPLQYSCLENPMDRGALWTAVHGGRKE